MGDLSVLQLFVCARIRIIKKRKALKRKFIKLMNKKEFNDAVSQGTGSIKSVKTRFSSIEKIIREVLA